MRPATPLNKQAAYSPSFMLHEAVLNFPVKLCHTLAMQQSIVAVYQLAHRVHSPRVITKRDSTLVSLPLGYRSFQQRIHSVSFIAQGRHHDSACLSFKGFSHCRFQNIELASSCGQKSFGLLPCSRKCPRFVACPHRHSSLESLRRSQVDRICARGRWRSQGWTIHDISKWNRR